MRAVLLSDSRVREVLNRLYVPCLYAHEDGNNPEDGADPADRAEFDRILAQRQIRLERDPGSFDCGVIAADYHYRDKKRLPPLQKTAMTVLSPAGDVVGESNVTKYMDPVRLTADLERFAAPWKGRSAPNPTRFAPAASLRAEADDLRVRVTARFLQKPEMPEIIPVQEWVVLRAQTWRQLLPAQSTPGFEYEVPREVAASLLMHMSPPTWSGGLSSERVRTIWLRGRVIEYNASSGIVTVYLRGRLEMEHPFLRRVVQAEESAGTHREQGRLVETVVGHLELDARQGRITRFDLVSDDARYYGVPSAAGPLLFAAAVHAVGDEGSASKSP